MLDEFIEEQPVAYKILSKIIRDKTFSHAYLIETNGYDKGLKLAISFAKSILCPEYKKNSLNCNNCNQCKTIDENNHPELKIIIPDGSMIKKDQLLELQEEFSKKALTGEKKVYILYQAEKLNINSSNSILKFLEEPQENIVAILVTENQYQLLNTILSRCQIISLNGQIDINFAKDTFSKVGQILTNTEEDYKNFIEDEKSKNLLENAVKFANLYEKNNKKTILYLNQYWFSNFNDKIEMDKAIKILLYFYKDVLNVKINRKLEIFLDYSNDINNISKINTIEQIIKKISSINKCRENIETNANLNLLMDKLIIEMSGE